MAAAALVMLVAAIGVHRRLTLPRPRLGTLLAAQLAVVASLETATVLGGRPVASTALLVALLLQFPAAVVATALTGRVRRLVARLSVATRSRLTLAAATSAVRPTTPVHPRSVSPSPTRSRAPPLTMVAPTFVNT
jgi:hypothetical protein